MSSQHFQLYDLDWQFLSLLTWLTLYDWQTLSILNRLIGMCNLRRFPVKLA